MATEPARRFERPPYAFARRHGVVPVGFVEGRLRIAHTDAIGIATLAELQRAYGAALAL